MTAIALSDKGLDAQRVDKMTEGRPNIQEAMLYIEVDLVIINSQGAADKFGG